MPIDDKELMKQIGIYQAGVPGYKQSVTKPKIKGSPTAYTEEHLPRFATFEEGITQRAPYVAGHEFEHQLSNLSKQRYNIDKSILNEPQTDFFFKNLDKSKLDPDKVLSYMMRGFSNPDVYDYLSKKFNIPDTGRIGKSNQPFNEYLADLSGIETHYGVDLTKDPFIRKTIFNDNDKLIQVYKSVTGLRQQRLDAKDLPPYEYQAPTGKMETIYNLLRQKLSNPLK